MDGPKFYCEHVQFQERENVSISPHLDFDCLHAYLRCTRWTLLTACFSHNGMLHLFSNAFTFYFMAPVVLSIMPHSTFLALYLGGAQLPSFLYASLYKLISPPGGIVASLSSLWWNNAVKHYPNYSSHGASGELFTHTPIPRAS